MITLGKAVFALCFALAVAGLLLWPAGFDFGSVDSEPAAPAAAAVAEPPTPAAEPAKAGPKVIGLAEAVVIAERVGKGMATKAERKDRPEPSFKIEVYGRDGQKRKIELNVDGTVKGEKMPEEKRVDKK